MKYYYYAFSSHKGGLDSVKRGVALIKAMRERDIEVGLLVNDFRAGLVARELGVMGAVTLESFMDIDVIASRGDMVFIDTPEDITSRLEQYSDEYRPLFVVSDRGATAQYGEKYLTPTDSSLSSLLIDSCYFESHPKAQRVLFFYGDSDHEKVILREKGIFKGLNMELLLGHYFFLKYEEELASVFSILHEASEYTPLVQNSNTIVTASTQCALEASASGARVIYIQKMDDSQELLEKFHEFDIKIIDSFNHNKLVKLIESDWKPQSFAPNTLPMLISSLLEMKFS